MPGREYRAIQKGKSKAGDGLNGGRGQSGDALLVTLDSLNLRNTTGPNLYNPKWLQDAEGGVWFSQREMVTSLCNTSQPVWITLGRKETKKHTHKIKTTTWYTFILRKLRIFLMFCVQPTTANISTSLMEKIKTTKIEMK